MSTPKKIDHEAQVARQAEFDKLYGFMISAAALTARSSNPEESVVGERLHAFLCEKRLAARKKAVGS